MCFCFFLGCRWLICLFRWLFLSFILVLLFANEKYKVHYHHVVQTKKTALCLHPFSCSVISFLFLCSLTLTCDLRSHKIKLTDLNKCRTEFGWMHKREHVPKVTEKTFGNHFDRKNPPQPLLVSASQMWSFPAFLHLIW